MLYFRFTSESVFECFILSLRSSSTFDCSSPDLRHSLRDVEFLSVAEALGEMSAIPLGMEAKTRSSLVELQPAFHDVQFACDAASGNLKASLGEENPN